MFKWGSRRESKQSSPKMPNLLDDRYSPVAYQPFPEKPRKKSFLSRFSSPEKRATTPIVGQPVWQMPQHPPPEMMHVPRQRQRTMSTPSRPIEGMSYCATRDYRNWPGHNVRPPDLLSLSSAETDSAAPITRSIYSAYGSA